MSDEAIRNLWLQGWRDAAAGNPANLGYPAWSASYTALDYCGGYEAGRLAAKAALEEAAQWACDMEKRRAENDLPEEVK